MAGHRCRGGLKAHAPSVGRPGFASGPSVERTRRPGGRAGRRAAALAIMQRGANGGAVRLRTRASPTIAKSISIDQLNVAMTCIRFPTTLRPRDARRGGVAGRAGYRGNPDGCECSRDGSVHDNAAYKRRSRCITSSGSKAVDTCASTARCGMVWGYGQIRTSQRVEGKADGIRLPLSGHIPARQAMSSTKGKTAEGEWPARRSGTWQRLMKPEENRRSGRRSGPAARRAEARVGMPTPSARRCANRAPGRASGDQSQSRWWRCLRRW